MTFLNKLQAGNFIAHLQFYRLHIKLSYPVLLRGASFVRHQLVITHSLSIGVLFLTLPQLLVYNGAFCSGCRLSRPLPSVASSKAAAFRRILAANVPAFRRSVRTAWKFAKPTLIVPPFRFRSRRLGKQFSVILLFLWVIKMELSQLLTCELGYHRAEATT